MRCPRLKDLPFPPTDKTGWPWTEETLPLSNASRSAFCSLPKVSIVTPSYNQGRFIEETIRSVLLQGYPNLEYIIIDGGSTDNSVEIIKKYEKWLTYWVSEPDKGQSDAINKGLRKAKGEIFAWLNSDDIYEPHAVKTAASYLGKGEQIAMIYGECYVINENGIILRKYPTMDFDLKTIITDWNFIPQPATFFKKSAFENVGMLDISLNYSMDRDLWIRIGSKFKICRIPYTLAKFRLQPTSKIATRTSKGRRENLLICRKYGGSIFSPVYYKYCLAEIKKYFPLRTYLRKISK